MQIDMNIATELEAIRSAVRKWSMIVHQNGADKRMDNCGLCIMFIRCNFEGRDCPVITLGGGYSGCKGTPYGAWIRHQKRKHANEGIDISMSIRCPRCREYAQAELMFLQKVLETYKGDYHERM